jgi:hypothetical protein
MRPVEDNQPSPGRPRPGGHGRAQPTRRPNPSGRRSGGDQRRDPADRRGGPERPVRGRDGRTGRTGSGGRPARAGSGGRPGDSGTRTGSGGRPARDGSGSGGRTIGDAGRGGGAARRGDGAPAAAVDEPGVGEVLPAEALDELRETARPHAFADAARALADAVVALAEEGDPEAAVRAARAAKRAAPRAASVREALGIALYQVGEFRAARTELAAAQRISGRGDLDAMLADIERGLGRPERAIAIFERSNRSRMEPDTAAELLLVAASAYGDLGQPAAGVALIRRHARWPVELADHHLRLAYAEGSLAEQAGDPARARAAFTRVVQADSDFHDAADRLERLETSGGPPGTADAT